MNNFIVAKIMLKNNAMQNGDLYRILVDDEYIEFRLSGSKPEFGEPLVLAEREEDILGHTSWYRDGYTVETLFSEEEFFGLVSEVKGKIKEQLALLGIALPSDFVLEDYHKYVKSDDIHQKIIEVTREFRMQNFSYNFEKFIDRVSRVIGHQLKSENNEISEYSAFLIVRINRPGSNDYNPPHKDGYLPVWQRTVNLWIPMAGVTSRSSLPIVPGSHLIPEHKIKRTMGGAMLNGKPYRVPAIVQWEGESRMIRTEIKPCDVLIFSPLLIHGCAKNMQSDTTRIALELRLSSAST